MEKDLIVKRAELKELGEEGTGLARIATLSAVDSDGDTYAPGAFGEQHVKVLPAHDHRAVPLGRARLYERGDEALAEFTLNLGTQAGRDWHAALKFDFESGRPLQEWSYGFRILDAATEIRGEERVRVLKRLKVHEISPVVLGAGIGTATLAVKRHGSFRDQVDGALAELRDIVVRAGEIKQLREADGRALSAERLAQLGELKAACAELAALEAEIDALLKQPGPDDNGDGAKAVARFQAIRSRRHLPPR